MKRSYFYIALLSMFFISCFTSPETKEILLDSEMLELKNGVLFYNGKQFNGSLVSYYASGILKSEVQFLNGRKQGYEKEWFSNGKLGLERYYSDGVKVGIHKSWWTNGNIKFTYQFNNKGEYNGRVREWFENGNLYRDFNYKNGKEVGNQKMWYSNNKIKANYEVVNGERFGLIGLKKCYTVIAGKDEVKK